MVTGNVVLVVDDRKSSRENRQRYRKNVEKHHIQEGSPKVDEHSNNDSLDETSKIDVLPSIYGVQPSVSGPNVKATSRKYWRNFDESVQRNSTTQASFMWLKETMVESAASQLL